MKLLQSLILSLVFSKVAFANKISKLSYNNPQDSVYSIFDTAASFSGGNVAWIKFIEKNLEANIGVKNGAKAGSYKVKIRFVVSKTGVVKNCIPVTQNKFGFEEEFIRVLKLSPKWNAAKLNGAFVDSWTERSITFTLDNQ